jgi:hypothetical protein
MSFSKQQQSVDVIQQLVNTHRRLGSATCSITGQLLVAVQIKSKWIVMFEPLITEFGIQYYDYLGNELMLLYSEVDTDTASEIKNLTSLPNR